MNSEQYYTRHGRKIQGPFDIDRLRRLASLGRFSRGHQVSTDRVSWFPASELTEIFGEQQPTSRNPVAQPATAAGELEFPSDSRAQGNHLALWIGIPVALLFLAVTIGGGIWWFAASKKSDHPSGLMITGMDDEKKLEDAVGFLVTYKEVVTKGGTELDKPFVKKDKNGKAIKDKDGDEILLLPRGSCFMVSSDGYALTNKHAIEDYQKYEKAGFDTEQERFEHRSVEPKRVAFFDGRRYPVEKIVYVSDEFDMAILKIARRKSPYFALSESSLGRTMKVWTCGFPGAANDMLTQLENDILKARRNNASRLKQRFPKTAFEYTSNGGDVSKTVEREGVGEVIQHGAAINDGNSGGPLISAEGTVYGINTFRITVKGTQNIFFSLTLRQLRKEIDEHVSNAVWK